MPSVSVKFYLESKVKGNDKKLLPIFLYIRHQNKTIKVFTERKCTRSGWDVKRSRANPRKYKSSTELNGFLSELEEGAATLYNKNSRNGTTTTKAQIARVIQEASGNKIKNQNLVEFASDFLKKGKLADSTLKGYTTTLNILREFASSKRVGLEFSDIDLNFYDNFTSWLWKVKNQNDNSVGKHIKNIKALMSQAFERDLHNNLDFKKKKFQVLRRESDSIYLNEGELNKLIALDLTGNDRLCKVRDAFFVASWTGLRFSDLARITKDKFIIEDDIELFKIETEKTGEIVKIPVAPVVKPILLRYDFKLPVLTNQKMNQYLKELGELAGIDQVIEVSDLKNGKKIRVKYQKHELITTHTARRSFASNLYLQGVPSRSIMAVTGHRTEKAFLAYIKLSNMERIREIDLHFKKIHSSKLKTA